MVAGVGRALDAIERFSFDDAALETLRAGHVVDERTLEWLADYRFPGDIWGYPEGEIYFPCSPLMIVESSFGEAVVLETLLLAIYNHDSAIASAASRMTVMAGDRPCIEMGSGSTHEYRRWRPRGRRTWRAFRRPRTWRPAGATGYRRAAQRAHAFTLLHATEREAFAAQVAELGEGTTLLVDTYDVFEAVQIGGGAHRRRLGAVRLDSGDLGLLATQVRDLLDSLGATQTKIIVTSDLDEFTLAALAGAPVDGYGVGTSLVTGSGHPTCEFVYKLVARAESDAWTHRWWPRGQEECEQDLRRWSQVRPATARPNGQAEAEVVGIGSPPVDDGDDRSLLVPLVRDGKVVGREDLDTIRARHLASRAELPLRARQMSRGEPVIPTEHLEG